MKYDEIKKYLEKDEIAENEKEEIKNFIESKLEEIKRISSESAKRKEQIRKHEENNHGQNPKFEEFENTLNKMNEKLSIFVEKINNENEALKPKLEELQKKLPENYQKFIPDLKTDEKIKWLENAMEGGLFSDGTDELGSEITVTDNSILKNRIRPMTQREISNLTDEEYEELKKSGKLDLMLRHNLITG